MTEVMTGLVQYALQPQAVELRELPVPEIGDEDVLLRVGAVSVCGSDVHQYHNKQSWAVNVPVVLGHEFGGTVARVGARVRAFKEGDRVVSETAASICGQCVYCRAGEYNLCPQRAGFGYGTHGAMAEFVRVPARCLHHIPDALAFERAALTEPCCVGYNAVVVKSRVRPGDVVVVLGPGPIGLIAAEMARISGAGTLIVAGTSADAPRLAAARALGVTHAVDLEATDLPALVRTLGDGLGADLVVDATGTSIALKTALDIVRPGGQVTKVGWGPQPLGFSLDPLVLKAITLQGSFSHNWPIWERVIQLLSSGQLNIDPVIGGPWKLDQWQQAFSAMHSGTIVKAVLMP
jgi:alcohol dehydrogenase/L-iditol 2-dehydrogenase